MTFAKAIQRNRVEAAVQKTIDSINKSCRENPDSPRDAGVRNPKRFITHPLKLVKVEIWEPLPEECVLTTATGEKVHYKPSPGPAGELIVDSAWGEKRVEFWADDIIDEFVQMELMEALHWPVLS